MLGIVADDLTGALDAALVLHSEGVMAPVLVGVESFRRRRMDASTAILDVDSRGDSPEVAYRKVRSATRALLDAGYTHIYKKMSSTFQGHIGREVDAVMDETGADFAVVVPAFPANGRTTRGGIHYIDGVPLSETGVGRHPTSPITDSYLPRVLQAQTSRKVGLVTFDIVQQGIERLDAELWRLADEGGMAIVDVTSDADLRTVAQATRALGVSAGGAALAGRLASREQTGTSFPPEMPAPVLKGCLILAGSVSPVTSAQVAHFIRSGADATCLDVLELLDAGRREAEVERASQIAIELLRAGRDVLIHTPSDAESQARARDRGAELGMEQMEVGLAIAEGLAGIAIKVVDATGLNRLITAGGDTSSIVCQRMGLDLHLVLEEIQTGIPLSLSCCSQRLVTVLKSGNFGTEDFFTQALKKMR